MEAQLWMFVSWRLLAPQEPAPASQLSARGPKWLRARACFPELGSSGTFRNPEPKVKQLLLAEPRPNSAPAEVRTGSAALLSW